MTIKLRYYEMIFFISKLHTHPVDLEPTTLSSIPLLREEEVSFELGLIGYDEQYISHAHLLPPISSIHSKANMCSTITTYYIGNSPNFTLQNRFPMSTILTYTYAKIL